MYRLAVASLLAARAAAWGTLGHETVGWVAQNFVSSETKAWAQKILNNDTESYLAGVATWADSFKYTEEGSFSSSLHYIDAEDDPPNTCNVQYDRDCKEDECVVGAIANYTQRIQDDSLDTEQTSQALMFLVHFIGDLHQPLHDEALEVGGNNINVTFDGEESNLHSAWDTEIPEKLIGGYEIEFAKSWGNNLTHSIKNGKYKGSAKKWLQNVDIKDAKGSSMDWANEANNYVCTTVMPDGIDAVEGEELYPAYYKKNVPIIELMIAKAGYRLAAWLDLLATGKTELELTFNDNVKRDESSVDDFIPTEGKQMLSEAKIKRMAFGSDCGCSKKHKH